MTRTALYRHYNATGALLYVGISDCLSARDKQHAATAHWHGAVARTETEWCEDRPEAEAAERSAILQESPLHNKRNAKAAANNRTAPKRADHGLRSFQASLAAHMAQHGTAIVDLAKATGISRDAINKIKGRAGASTSVENAVLIAGFYGQTVNAFMDPTQDAGAAQ